MIRDPHKHSICHKWVAEGPHLYDPNPTHSDQLPVGITRITDGKYENDGLPQIETEMMEEVEAGGRSRSPSGSRTHADVQA